ncbi:hypothetical protein PWT90_04985 [Aphanocladium album]|nr:hypothetical protein PWT90_04985 [Aphanocladium album]
MKFAAVLSFVAAAVALPADQPPSTDGQCLGVEKGSEPGSWILKDCAVFTFPPGSDCTASPEDLSKPYPYCCSKPVCP